MNQDVPQPTTATRSPSRGSRLWDSAATSTARRQQSGCDISSAWTNGCRSMGTPYPSGARSNVALLERAAGQAGLDLPVEQQIDDHHRDDGDGQGGEQG